MVVLNETARLVRVGLFCRSLPHIVTKRLHSASRNDARIFRFWGNKKWARKSGRAGGAFAQKKEIFSFFILYLAAFQLLNLLFGGKSVKSRNFRGFEQLNAVKSDKSCGVFL